MPSYGAPASGRANGTAPPKSKSAGRFTRKADAAGAGARAAGVADRSAGEDTAAGGPSGAEVARGDGDEPVPAELCIVSGALAAAVRGAPSSFKRWRNRATPPTVASVASTATTSVAHRRRDARSAARGSLTVECSVAPSSSAGGN